MRCIATVFIEVQNAPKWHFLGAGVGFGKFVYLKVGRAIPYSKSLCTHAISVREFQLLPSIRPGYHTPKHRNIGT